MAKGEQKGNRESKKPNRSVAVDLAVRRDRCHGAGDLLLLL
jgi:hypothetical protein